jgi:hypothetical protein
MAPASELRSVSYAKVAELIYEGNAKMRFYPRDKAVAKFGQLRCSALKSETIVVEGRGEVQGFHVMEEEPEFYWVSQREIHRVTTLSPLIDGLVILGKDHIGDVFSNHRAQLLSIHDAKKLPLLSSLMPEEPSASLYSACSLKIDKYCVCFYWFMCCFEIWPACYLFGYVLQACMLCSLRSM